MSDSGWSDNELVSKKLRHKKIKAKDVKEKKRKRSNSIESFHLEKNKKKKKLLKDHYESEPEDQSSYKKKTSKEKDKSNKITGRKESLLVESDSERGLKTNTTQRKGHLDKSVKSKKSNHKSNSLDDSHEGSAYEDDYKKDLEKQAKNKRGSDHKHNSSSRKQDKKSKEIHRESSKRNNRSQKSPDSDGEIMSNDKRKSRKRDRDREYEGTEERSRHLDKEYKKSSRSRQDDKFSDSLDRDSLSQNGDDNSRASSNEKPYRYWSVSQKPLRKNSDSYWNKYSDRIKESTEPLEVGPRYYSASDNAKNERKNPDTTRSKDRQHEKKDDAVKTGDENITEKKDKTEAVPAVQKKAVGLLTTRTGGAYIPPAKLRMMQESITDKASAAYQRLAWEALKKSIQGHVNKVNISNIRVIYKAILKENIVRGKGLLCRALIQAQAASPSFTNVYAAFVSALNAKFPKLGELLLKRLVVQFRRGFKRNDKTICITAATFIAHLVNQEVAHEIIALEILTLLIETPTDDSVEVAIAFLKECGMKLTEVSSKGMMAIFDMLRNILHEGSVEKRVQYMIEVMFQVRKDDFKAHPSVGPGLDLLDENDRCTHMITLEDNHDPEEILNVFKFDPDYEANEEKYKASVEIDEESDEEGSSGSGDSDDESEDEEEEGAEEGGEGKGVIVDRTETNLVALRKTIYLTIQSSLDFEECAHKLLRMEIKPGQEIEMAHMFLDCCAEQRTYEKFYGLLSQRFCQINRAYIGPFEETFRDSYETIHRMSNDKLRNVGKLFAHLLFTDAISWDVLSIIRLNEDDTTSSSRIFIKILFLELSEYMGLAKLNQRVKDPSLQTALEGLFPRDNPKHTRFAINFFTSIGLGGLTDELREHLKSQPKPSLAVPQLVEGLSSSSSSDSSSESSDSSDSSSDSSSSDSSSSQSEDKSRSVHKNKKGKESSKTQSSNKIDKSKSLKKRKSPPPRRKRDR